MFYSIKNIPKQFLKKMKNKTLKHRYLTTKIAKYVI
jgi:hypothetical protein